MHNSEAQGYTGKLNALNQMLETTSGGDWRNT